MKSAIVTVFIFGCITKFLGIAREVVFAAYYGATSLTDAFIIANTIPTLFGVIVQSGATAAIIPVLNSYINREKQESIYEIVSSLLLICLLFSALFTGLMLLFASNIISVIAPGLSLETHVLATQLLKILVLSLPFLALLGVVIAYQYSFGLFTFPSLIGIPFNLIIIVGIYLFSYKYGIVAAAYATVVSAAIQLLIQLLALKKLDFRMCFYISWSHPGITAVRNLFLPTILGIASVQISVFVDRFFASTLPEGSVAALSFSSKVCVAIYSVFFLPLITVAFPAISKNFSSSHIDLLRQDFWSYFKYIILIAFPICVLVNFFHFELSKVIFQRGVFDSSSTLLTSEALLFYSLGLPGLVMTEFFTRILYALHKAKENSIVILGVMLVNIILNALLINKYFHSGLALATSISQTIGALILLIIIIKTLQIKVGMHHFLFLGRTVSATMIMIGFMSFMYGLLKNQTLETMGMLSKNSFDLIIIAITSMLSIILYLFAAHIFKVKEVASSIFMMRNTIDSLLKKFNAPQ